MTSSQNRQLVPQNILELRGQALQKLRQKSWEVTAEEESLDATLENRHRA